MKHNPRLFKSLLLALLVVLTALAQHAFFPAAGASHTAWLLLALTTAIAMREREPRAAVFGLLAGALWDIASPLPDGALALFFFVFACAASLLSHFVFRQSLLTAAVLCAGGSVALGILLHILNVAGKDPSAFLSIVFASFLPCFLLTAVSLPLYYYLVRTIDRKWLPAPGNRK